MKYLSIIFLLMTTSVYAKHNFNIELTPKDDVFDKMLTSLWSEIPYNYELSEKTYFPIKGNSVTVQLNKTKINLGPKGMPLFNMRIKSENNFDLNWDLSQLTTQISAKLRFKFKKYGISVTHDEYFKVSTRGIKTSKTNLNLLFENKKFNFSLIKNSGFKFQNVDVKPQNGIGQVLRYIFENVFSKDQVNQYITEAANKELKKWINDNKLISEVQMSLNTALNKAQNTDIEISEIANYLRANFREFYFSPSVIKIGMSPTFNYENLKVHSCAEGMIKSDNKDILVTSHSLIETMINNYATYELWEDNKLIEPIFCFGFKDYDQSGNPIGEIAESKLLGKTVRFNYWVTPSTKPLYEYIPEESLVKITMNMQIKILSSKYPILKANNDLVTSKLVGHFKVEFDEVSGLNLVFEKFELPTITGRVKVKWNRFTPFVRVPLNTIRASIEKYINIAAIDQLESLVIVEPEFTFMNGLVLAIKGYNMTSTSHTISFETK